MKNDGVCKKVEKLQSVRWDGKMWEKQKRVKILEKVSKSANKMMYTTQSLSLTCNYVSIHKLLYVYKIGVLVTHHSSFRQQGELVEQRLHKYVTCCQG